MKKILSFILLALLPLVVNADPVEIDGFGRVADAVDLGLSVKWASWNVGASKIEDYGGLYGAGDPTGLQTSTSYSDYHYYEVSNSSICGTEYDIAHVKWGGNWRMPTFNELKELAEQCNWVHNIIKDGVIGSVATGPNGNSIFIPYAIQNDNSIHASLWSGDQGNASTIYTYSYSYKDIDINYANNGIVRLDGCNCWFGQSVRPVYVENGTSIKGSGTEEDPYLISSAEELKKFNELLVNSSNIHGRLVADIVLNENVLDENYNLNGDGSQFEQWISHGLDDGSFNGAGHTISGLYINNNNEYQALFETASRIDSLGIVDSYIKAYRHAGGLCSWLRNGNKPGGVISNCFFDGVVIASSDKAGGISAHMGNGYDGGYQNIIINCYSKGKVSGYNHVGGICGSAYSLNSSNSDYITNCYNIATVSASWTDCGEICGYADNAVGSKVSAAAYNCYALGSTKIGQGYRGETKSLEEFKNGTVLNLLNSNGGNFHQNIGVDTYPILFGGADSIPVDTVEIDGFGRVAEPVDLGLSVKWASWSVGASRIEDYGGLYGAGDPTGLQTSTSYLDYHYYEVSNSSICGTEYDIAHVKWGDNWRMPTFAELKELAENCSWVHNVTKDGVKGSVATGPNGNTLFFPYSGIRHGTSASHFNIHASLWSGEQSNNPYSCGYKDLDINIHNTGEQRMDGNYCYYGQSVRPVYVENSTSIKGSGTKEDPYLISSAEELKWFIDQSAENESLCAKLTNDIVLNENVLDDEYNLNGDGSQFEQWQTHNYNGHFNGNGHTISGIYINNEEEQSGLFWAIHSESIIENLGIIDSYIHSKRHAGGITSWVHNGATVNSCYFDGRVIATSDKAGGIAAHMGNTDGVHTAKIINCYNKGKISGNYHVGGICGSAFSLTDLDTDYIENCFNVGDVSASWNHCGAICGYVQCSVRMCYSLSGSCSQLGAGYSGETKSLEEFKNGTVLNLLNSNGGNFHQNIGVDTYPILFGGSGYTAMYTINFDTNGGTTIESITQDYGTTITPPENPTREGYTFLGWEPAIPETMPIGGLTVVAQWQINNYTITYLVDGEEYKTSSVTYGTNLTPEEEPTREGYTFSGWNGLPETMPAEDVVVTGTFIINQYLLTYILDGEEYKSYEIDYNTALTPEPVPVKKGMTFSGWGEIPETMPAHDLTLTGSYSWSKETVDGVIYQVTDTLSNYASVIGTESMIEEATILPYVEIGGDVYEVYSIADNALPKTVTIYVPVGKLLMWLWNNGYEDIRETESGRSLAAPEVSLVAATASSLTLSYVNQYPEFSETVMVSDKPIEKGKNGYEVTLRGLEPDNLYEGLVSLTLTYDDATYTKAFSFSTSPLTLTTLQPKVVSLGNVVVAANSNLDNRETKVGFEWRRIDWTDDFASNFGRAYLYEGTMEGYIRNMNTDKLWKYRPYYTSDAGNSYYGDWVGIDPTNISYFQPTVHTYSTINLIGNLAEIWGYVMRGTDNISSQGFMYWNTGSASSRRNANGIPSDAKTILASGNVMSATLDNLDYDTEYCYVAFVTTSEGETFYGEPQSFRISPVDPDGIKSIENGKLIIENDVYDLSGRKLDKPQKGINIIRYSDGTTRKVLVK